MLYTVPTRGFNTTEYLEATEYDATDDFDNTEFETTNMECEWIRNNWNTDGEQYVGHVTSLEECVDRVQANCEWASIANVHENAADGSYASCWCQHGDDQTHDGSASYLNCWFDGVSGDSNGYHSNQTSSSPYSEECYEHGDCPESRPFCYGKWGWTYHGYCDSCDECHWCSDGVDSTCGSCGAGYPKLENVDSCNGDSSEDDSSQTIIGDNCEWIRNNWNTDGEEYVGHVSSLEDCVELVQDMCEWATIANVHENAADGYNASCWCQTGNYGAHDSQSEWLNCWLDGSPATTSAPIVCREHDDCPESRPLCYYTGWDWLSGNYGTCESCDECHWCQDGVDNTCGSCGEGYPVREDVEFCDGAMDRKLAPFLFIAPFVFAIVLALDQ